MRLRETPKTREAPHRSRREASTGGEHPGAGAYGGFQATPGGTTSTSTRHVAQLDLTWTAQPGGQMLMGRDELGNRDRSRTQQVADVPLALLRSGKQR